jgi:hypothetical protein
VFLEPRRRLFTRHFTGEHGEHLLDARIHMAPPLIPGQSAPKNDFMARVYLPQFGRGANNPGGAVPRPLAEARFHVQHPECAHSFTEFVVKTEGGGAAFATGALNLTAALARLNEDKTAVTSPLAVGDMATASSESAAARTRARSAVSGPRGLSAFFNLPLFGRGKAAPFPPAAAAQVEGLSMAAGSAIGGGAAFKARSVLRDAPTVGLRWDQSAKASDAHVASYSCGVHLDPQATMSNLRAGGLDGAGRSLQLGGWLSQQSDNFRFAAEGTVAPMQRYGAHSAPGAGAASQNPNDAAASGARVGPASMVPLSLAARMPLLLESRFGFFFHDSQSLTSRATQPAYEVGFTVINRAEHGHGLAGAAAPLRGVQEFVASYCHHLTVRRNIHNPLEKAHNRSIHNYIDLAMEVVYRNEIGSGAAAQAQEAAAAPAAALAPPSIRLGASWQLNKNSMIKARVQDDSVGLLYAIKSWSVAAWRETDRLWCAQRGVCTSARTHTQSLIPLSLHCSCIFVCACVFCCAGGIRLPLLRSASTTRSPAAAQRSDDHTAHRHCCACFAPWTRRGRAPC